MASSTNRSFEEVSLIRRRASPRPFVVADAFEALQRLKRRGFLLIVVSNQPDVRRGTTPRHTVEEIHAWLAAQLPLDDVFVCYHDDADACACRKPLPGLIFEAVAKYGIDTNVSYLIGDRWRDIDAGAAAGCRTIFIDRRYNERSPASAQDATVSSLPEAVDWIIARESY